MIDLKQHLSTAKLPERIVPICLRGDLLGRLSDLRAELARAEDSQPADARLNTPPDATAALRQEAEALEAEVRENTLPFRVRGLSRAEWTALTGQHPPREDNDADKMIQFNIDTFPPMLVRACLVDPAPSDDEWDQLHTEFLGWGQFDRLLEVAMELSRREDELVPFLSSASARTATSVQK